MKPTLKIAATKTPDGEMLTLVQHDAILLDVDNGPEALTTAGNDHLYFLFNSPKRFLARSMYDDER